jgi:signal transduction histidine kinase
LENATRSSRTGFGLGLTFCHLATQAMDGSIWVESDGQSGTTFIFTLPIYKED